MKIALICATSSNSVIGVNNKLPWQSPADLKHFKEVTLHHTVIMGRKTYESIGKALPQRNNVVLTKQQDYQPKGCLVAHSIDEALSISHGLNGMSKVFVIGGESIYKQTLELAHTIYLTVIHKDFDGDARFEWTRADWKEIDRKDFPADDKNPYPYSFITLEHK